MASQTVHKPLLSSPCAVEQDYVKKPSFSVSLLAKLVIKSAICVVFILWIGIIFYFPSDTTFQIVLACEQLIGENIFGITGSLFLLFSAPILLISVLCIVFLVISGEEDEFAKRKILRYPRFRLWTFPVIVDGPFGVVSAAEFIGILLFCMYVIWAVYAYTVNALHEISDRSSFKEQSYLFLESMGRRIGSVGIYCLAFLFLPVARGSALLRFIDIPFEHATKYHVWLGHLIMVLFMIHGLIFVILWSMEGRLVEKILQWKDIRVANLPGVISLLAGLVMWVTSLPPVRKLNFELFFYTHQLYAVFVIFLALHAGDFIFCSCFGGIFIFVLDRFLRFCQSRRVIDLISAKCLPCGTVELTLSKPASLRYNALSFVFLQIRELSWLQWHPFSVSSSPLDGKYHMSVLIKVLGEWTEKLRTNIIDASEAVTEEELPLQIRAKLTASVEGPYGHESPYHLMYENLVLVAGGIGISPFLAILSDILHRINDRKPCPPINIAIIWAVKKSAELSLLSTVDMESICPFFAEKLNIETHIYVTRESEPPLEVGNAVTTKHCPTFLSSKGSRRMSGLVGTGHKVWCGLYLVISLASFIALMGLLNVFYINPYGITQWWYKGLLLLACTGVSVIVFGGGVIGLWHLWETWTLERDQSHEDDGIVRDDNGPLYQSLNHHQKNSTINPVNSTRLNYGTRPDFKEILAYLAKSWGSVDAGVLVCGPPTLQTSVAKEIRSHNFTREQDHPIFHFNSHSFDL